MSAGNGYKAPGDLEITVAQYVQDWQAVPHVLIDVREPEEWDAGHIGTASLLPLGDLENRLDELDPAVPVAIICRSGRRSLFAAEALAQRGFANPVSIAGGMIAWSEAGHPVAQ